MCVCPCIEGKCMQELVADLLFILFYFPFTFDESNNKLVDHACMLRANLNVCVA